jgi:hypothetical protein
MTRVCVATSISFSLALILAGCSGEPDHERGSATVAQSEVSGVEAKVSCETNGGVNPIKADLAVAMAEELRRWDPVLDLVVNDKGKVVLSDIALARCTDGCPKARAILNMQDDSAALRQNLSDAWERHTGRVSSRMHASGDSVQAPHTLTFVGGPIQMGTNSCGPHYVFQADNANGSPLSVEQALGLEDALCFYGQGDCGNNPYLAFMVTDVACATGRTCVAVDPTREDGGSVSTTHPGAIPTFPNDRLWDPGNTFLNWRCLTTSGYFSYMVSYCSTVPASCGYLYCAQANQPVIMLWTNVGGTDYAMNAFWGAYEYYDGSQWIHTTVSLHNGCASDNPDCLWIYRPDRMLASLRDPSLAINAWGGAGEGVTLVLTRWCTPDNPDCTWSFVNGRLVNDRYPWLSMSAPQGGYAGSPIKLQSYQPLIWGVY